MIELPWGDGTLSVPVPAGWRILGPFSPAPLEPAADPHAACREALSRPLDAKPLADRDLTGKRVLLVADDVSRPTPVADFFAPVRDALVAAGAAPADIEILFALGVHRPMTEAEAAAKVGAANLAAHRWHNHDAFNPAQLVRLGTTARGTPVALNKRLTEFDLIVTLGAVEPHLLLGFSGGLKMLLPGCAANDTIQANHEQGTQGERFDYAGAAAEDSPMRLDLEDGVAMLGKDVFAVNAVLTPTGRVGGFFCGDPKAVVRAGGEFVRRHAEVPPPEPADVVIANSRPFDADLRQGLKCLGNTLYAARPGGVMLGFFRCELGMGDVAFPAWTVPNGVLRPWLRLLGPRRIKGFSRIISRLASAEERFLTHFGLRMLHRNHLWFFSDNLPVDTGKRLGVIRQFASVETMLAAAVRKVGSKATVAVYPFGGATYAPDAGKT